MVSANGIWTTDYIKPEYIETVKKIHGVEAGVLPATFDPINEYVSEKTNGMLTDLFEKGTQVNPLTVAVIVNAVYLLSCRFFRTFFIC